MKLKDRSITALIAAAMILAGLGFLSSCEKYAFITEEVNPTDTVHFQAQIQPIFTANCITCHKGSRNPDLRDGNSWESLTSGHFVDLPAETSRLYRQVTSSSHSPFTLPNEKQLILTWIQQGAKKN